MHIYYITYISNQQPSHNFSTKIILQMSKAHLNTIHSLNLDHLFVNCLQIIQQSYHQFSKQIQLRIQRWVDSLLKMDGNSTLKRSRNNYGVLLVKMMQENKISQPFTKFPSQKNIPLLNDFEFKVIAGYKFQKESIFADRQLDTNSSDSDGESIPSQFSNGLAHQLQLQLQVEVQLQEINSLEQQHGFQQKAIQKINKLQMVNKLENKTKNRLQAQTMNRFQAQTMSNLQKMNKLTDKVQRILQKTLVANHTHSQPILHHLHLISKSKQQYQKELFQQHQDESESLVNKYENIHSNKLEKIYQRSLGEQAVQLQVDEGIQLNKIEIFQKTISPRTFNNQLQYFREALEL